MRSFNVTTSICLFVSSLSLAATACDKGDDAAAKKQEVLPQIKVELPPTPNFEEGKAPEKWEDTECAGAFSIYGLRDKIDEHVKEGKAGANIELCGWVQEIYVPPECAEGEFCPPGKQPHVWIADAADTSGKKRAMMVVNYRFQIPEWEAKTWDGQPDVVLAKGQRYRFRGKFKRFSDTGFSHDAGLLEFDSVEVSDEESGQKSWVYPPGASWHPVMLAQQEEENQRLAEKAAKTAADYKNRKR